MGASVNSSYYEDSYMGIGFDSTAELIDYCERRPDSLNWPIWVEATPGEDYLDEVIPPRLEVGWFSQRHGDAFICHYTGTYTEEDVQRLQQALIRVWVARAEAGFPRRGDLYGNQRRLRQVEQGTAPP